MLGSIKWNIGIAVLGCGLTFAFSIGNNGISITLLRSLYALAASFVLAYGLRYLLYVLSPAVDGVQGGSEEEKGSNLDMATPDDGEDIHRLLQQQLGGEKEEEAEHLPFQPLAPPRMMSVKDKSPDELAEAVRHLKES
ncbi:hypothetical protein ACFOQM_19460 [Paenibacillus sp. GCM10012307]|uniref:Uncharacterized protein n=1 Tax=Paenibacillus roseus TaxID=2798579 RepID=A0A934MWQ8_9BACL|nr:hypothetical protein [Paenibacillus roseus]MBJ6363402.1 hypothetical protein [Paenibacillus roseus]